MKVVEESRLCGGTDFGVHIHAFESRIASLICDESVR